MKIALASPPFPKSLNDGLSCLEKLVTEAATGNAEILYFPESFFPGCPPTIPTIRSRSLVGTQPRE